MNTIEKEIITRLESHIVSECSPVDTEELFAESLDESGDVDVCGLTFSPSGIWKEMDPTAFSCGTNNYVDSLMRDGELTDDIDGSHYRKDEAEKAKEEFVAELEQELEGLKTELADAEDRDCITDCEDAETAIEAKQAEIDACNSHSF